MTTIDSTDRPSKKQRELLSFIHGFIAGHGYGPSYREIMRALNYKSVSTVATHVDNLIAKGHLRKRDNSARSLEICSVPEKQFKAVPKATVAQEKWLVELIDHHFANARKSRDETRLDELYVLVGALHILGFADAATAAKAKLHDMQKQQLATQE